MSAGYLSLNIPLIVPVLFVACWGKSKNEKFQYIPFFFLFLNPVLVWRLPPSSQLSSKCQIWVAVPPICFYTLCIKRDKLLLILDQPIMKWNNIVAYCIYYYCTCMHILVYEIICYNMGKPTVGCSENIKNHIFYVLAKYNSALFFNILPVFPPSEIDGHEWNSQSSVIC